ncbi:MAG: sigma-54-dependent Fis family transcriptional regulator [Myxococcota bacterium]
MPTTEREGWLPDVAVRLERQSVPAILLSPSYEVLLANTAYLRAFGDGAVGRRCYEVSHHYDAPCDQRGERCPLAAARATNQSARVLHLHHTPRGLEHVDVTLDPVRGRQGELVAYVETLRPVDTASARAHAGLQVGRSAAFNEALELALRAAPSDVPVLLLGESGTGKERMARAVHDASARASGPFVALACSGLSESLFESELFGHEKGAFTGASARKIGLVESARGGTLFLDEIGDVPPQLQVKLLRLLEARQFRRVGGVEPVDADFRLVCATWRDLEAMVEEGTFRRDLYFRISAFPIHLPSLRERVDDIPLLVEAILAELGSNKVPSEAACAALARRPWPGNVRELRNVLQRAVLLADGDVIEAPHVAARTSAAAPQPAPTGPVPPDAIVSLEEAERRYIAWAAAQPGLDRKTLADKLGISERTLYRKLGRVGDED